MAAWPAAHPSGQRGHLRAAPPPTGARPVSRAVGALHAAARCTGNSRPPADRSDARHPSDDYRASVCLLKRATSPTPFRYEYWAAA